jgi:hypothetical protein
MRSTDRLAGIAFLNASYLPTAIAACRLVHEVASVKPSSTVTICRAAAPMVPDRASAGAVCQPRAAIATKQRVVHRARRQPRGPRRPDGEAIRRADNEDVETELGVEAAWLPHMRQIRALSTSSEIDLVSRTLPGPVQASAENSGTLRTLSASEERVRIENQLRTRRSCLFVLNERVNRSRIECLTASFDES